MALRKYVVAVARYPYSGNGGGSIEHPDVGDWLIDTTLEMRDDPRISRVFRIRKSDTPIPMTRNDSVYDARKNGADFLLMVDSDMAPDYELKQGDVTAKPFWKTSFDFLDKHYDKGPCIIGAPYAGPPPFESVYVFAWENSESRNANADWKLEMYSRSHAAIMGGIQEAGALPTGLILYDLRLFDHLPEPWFYYEYENDGQPCSVCHVRKPGPQRKKASTEDVTFTRDSSLILMEKLGYNPLYCNWDAWAGHWKPKCVGKPRLATVESVNAKYRDAILANHRSDSKLVHVGSTKETDEILRRMRPALPQKSEAKNGDLLIAGIDK